MALDRGTLDACRRGDPRAFRTLVVTYQQCVLSLCTAMAGSDAEDLAQETFSRVYRAIARFDPDGAASLRSWILLIARRLCHDRARSIARAAAFEPPAADPVIDPRGALEREERSREVARAIAALPVEQRVVLALREWEGIDYEEIAMIEGIPIGTVRSRLARAKEALRIALSREEEVRRVAL
jgi:RNA polymerase sigma-70 factor (ECF subfamily)